MKKFELWRWVQIKARALTLQWRHNGRDYVSNHRRLDCLLNRLSRRRSKEHQSSASLAFVRGIHRWPVKTPHGGPMTRKIFPFDDVIMICPCHKPYLLVSKTTCHDSSCNFWYLGTTSRPSQRGKYTTFSVDLNTPLTARMKRSMAWSRLSSKPPKRVSYITVPIANNNETQCDNITYVLGIFKKWKCSCKCTNPRIDI